MDSSGASGRGGSLREVVAKLGHREEEVRGRALKSLLFKLSHGLATQEQLWQVTVPCRTNTPVPARCCARLRRRGA